MKIINRLMFDIQDLAEEVLHKLKKCKDIARQDLNETIVTEAIFKWIDEWYLQEKMRWCQRPNASLLIWLNAIGVTPNEEIAKDSAHQWAINHIEIEMNELFKTLIPGRTWKALFIRREGPTSFVLEIGEDYRIYWYMENVHHKSVGKR